jgi:hypothetical protein
LRFFVALLCCGAPPRPAGADASDGIGTPGAATGA